MNKDQLIGKLMENCVTVKTFEDEDELREIRIESDGDCTVDDLPVKEMRQVILDKVMQDSDGRICVVCVIIDGKRWLFCEQESHPYLFNAKYVGLSGYVCDTKYGGLIAHTKVYTGEHDVQLRSCGRLCAYNEFPGLKELHEKACEMGEECYPIDHFDGDEMVEECVFKYYSVERGSIVAHC